MKSRLGFSAWNFFFLTTVTADALHRPGHHHDDSNFQPAFRASERRYDADQDIAMTGNPRKGKSGYIVLTMKNSGEDTTGTFLDTSTTAQIREISEASAEDEQETEKRDVEGDYLNRTSLNSNYMFGGYVRREIWVIPLISIVLLNIFLIVIFEIYVLCQARRQNPLFLGQFLLAGLLLCSGFSLVFVVRPSTLNCFFGTFGISVSYALIFSVLMVKSVFLVSLDDGNNLSLAYQACLLFFAVLVQVAISCQSLLLFPPSVDHVNAWTSNSLWSECGVEYNQSIWPMVSYNVFLILFVGLLAIKTRRIRENYGEATFIGFAILATIPIWVCWILATTVLHGRQQDASVAFGCQAQTLFTFLIIFMPKGRQLAAMAGGGKLLSENQDDEYSPSFLHLNLGKYYKKDRPNSFTTLERQPPPPTFSALNPNVYFYRPDYHPGLIY